MKTMALSIVLGLWMSAAAVAADTTAQSVVAAGFTAYTTAGAEAAVRAWTAGGSLTRNSATTEALSAGLYKVESLYGKYQTYHIVKTVAISETCQLTFAQLDYASGPLFMKFLAYKTSAGWSIVSLKFHTDIERIWPSALVGYPDDAE